MGTGASQTPLSRNSIKSRSLRNSMSLTSSSSPSPSPLFVSTTIHRPLNNPEQSWPLPPTEFTDVFQPNWPIDPERYSVKRIFHLKVEKTQKKTLTTVDRHRTKSVAQKETGSNESEKNSTASCESAHVKSSVRSQSQSCINLSTTEEIDHLIVRLGQIYTELDFNIQQKQNLVSTEAKSLIDLVVNDTRNLQQDLLAFAKERQMKQDDVYNEFLQIYLGELNKWKSIQLANLQDELQNYQREIVQHSQELISKINNESNSLRDIILQSEQRRVQIEIEELMRRFQTLSAHQLSTETLTKINLIIQGNVGTKFPSLDIDSKENPIKTLKICFDEKN